MEVACVYRVLYGDGSILFGVMDERLGRVLERDRWRFETSSWGRVYDGVKCVDNEYEMHITIIDYNTFFGFFSGPSMVRIGIRTDGPL